MELTYKQISEKLIEAIEQSKQGGISIHLMHSFSDYCKNMIQNNQTTGE